MERGEAMAILVEAAGKWMEELTESIIPDVIDSGYAIEDMAAYEDQAEKVSAALTWYSLEYPEAGEGE